MARQPRDAVQFTLESAERIADVVRAAELATPQGKPLTFEARFPERIPRQVRAATFSGSWAIGASKVVTFKLAPTATQAVTNLTWPISETYPTPVDCIVGKDGTSWWLVTPALEAPTAHFITQILERPYASATASQSVVTDVTISATLNTNDCQITIGKTVSTSSISVVSQMRNGLFIERFVTGKYLRIKVP
jgi:hypothetical protein